MSHEPICASGADQSREQTAIRNLVADGGLWLAMVLSLQAFRVLMLVLFRDEVSPETGLTQILRCIGTGLRFDVSMASYAILPTLALTLVGFFRPLGALHGRVRWTLAGVLTSVSLITFVVDVGYFQEYHDQFNHWIFGLLYDDNAAIAQRQCGGVADTAPGAQGKPSFHHQPVAGTRQAGGSERQHPLGSAVAENRP